MPPTEELATDERNTVTNKPTIGIIYPPPEVRNIVDKTASFVARNGPEFETRIRNNEINNPKFNFLNPNDPYHTYYQHKVKDFKEGKGQEPQVKSAPIYARPNLLEPIKVPEIIIPKEPPVEFEFMLDPPTISTLDLDVVKLTAQFVARNGRQFLTNLMLREKSYQFDFLRPQHSHFNYFTKLVEQYTKILLPAKDLIPKLKQEALDESEIMSQVKYRVEWEKQQEQQKKKEEEAAEKERVAYSQIDWHDFVVVETVDYQPNEKGNLPPPTSADEVGARMLALQRYDQEKAMEMEVESDGEASGEDDGEKEESPAVPGDDREIQDMEEGSDDDGDDEDDNDAAEEKDEKELSTKIDMSKKTSEIRIIPAPPATNPPQPPQPPLPPLPEEVIIRKDYNPKASKIISPAPNVDEVMISPLTGEKISSSQIGAHVKQSLLDPKWVKDRDKSIEGKLSQQEEVFAPGSSIGSSLKQLADRRTDIFGSGNEETQIGKKIGEEEKREEKMTWDGHSASMERVTQKARQNVSIEEQIATIHKVQGFSSLNDGKRNQHEHNRPPGLPNQSASSFRPPRHHAPQPPMSNTIRHQMSIPMPVPVNPQPPIMMLPPQPPQPRVPIRMQTLRPMRPPMMAAGPGPGYMQSAPPPPMSAPGDEPVAKKTRNEESLIPEDQYLQKHQGPVKFSVLVPESSEKSEWKLNGQMLSFTLPLTDSVSVIKAKIHESLGMPAGKQKLSLDNIFIKDSNTLAFYNFSHSSQVILQLKERGGRKR